MTTRSMRQTLLFGAAGLVAALATASGPARAQAYMPGDTPSQTGNVVGGGSATITGSGDDTVVTYSGGGAGGGVRYEQPGRVATFLGNDGSKPLFGYGAAANTNPGRVARLVGSGDDAQVVYAPMR